MDYQPIENYGVIGNMRSLALISVTGSIDFFCFPKFDSPTVFAALLDKNAAGSSASSRASRSTATYLDRELDGRQEHVWR
jgi:GH15 family glucan-1,4-alpha-glucosidase